MSGALDELCGEAGLMWRYWDGAGVEREAPVETRIAVLEAMGLPARTEAETADSLAALRAETERAHLAGMAGRRQRRSCPPRAP